MQYKGKVIAGVVVFQEGSSLAEGTEVLMEPLVPATQHGTIWDKLLKLAGRAEGLPVDAARNHDHYLYGTPKE